MALLTTQKKIVGPAQFELDLEVRIKRAGRPPWFSIFEFLIMLHNICNIYVCISISHLSKTKENHEKYTFISKLFIFVSEYGF